MLSFNRNKLTWRQLLGVNCSGTQIPRSARHWKVCRRLNIFYMMPVCFFGAVATLKLLTLLFCIWLKEEKVPVDLTFFMVFMCAAWPLIWNVFLVCGNFFWTLFSPNNVETFFYSLFVPKRLKFKLPCDYKALTSTYSNFLLQASVELVFF